MVSVRKVIPIIFPSNIRNLNVIFYAQIIVGLSTPPICIFEGRSICPGPHTIPWTLSTSCTEASCPNVFCGWRKEVGYSLSFSRWLYQKNEYQYFLSLNKNAILTNIFSLSKNGGIWAFFSDLGMNDCIRICPLTIKSFDRLRICL